ncbi:hypothetical protein COV42_02765 [Candidatus Campbellbacteria bacterium CG11_big_fil_rev_8_21_14_0_20_44_21]|nr:MAG: hypothetical protein COV42_02765 [Candidatus Campbellbacteria bacterium CG11_big_fil_rev_8_21_14_0_20_44_21]
MKENLKIVVVALILFAAFSVWNARLIEAKQNEGSIGREAKEEILWLGRVIYSETKEENEQVLIAWVVRNRVETGYRGKTYSEVANSPGQFSGLNAFDGQYLHNISREYGSRGEAWEKSLAIAEAVYNSPGFLRPFPQSVRHFYSPKSVSVHPEWSASYKPTFVAKDGRGGIRFAFYDSLK